MNKRFRKELIEIAHSYGVRCHFPKNLDIPSVDVFTKTIYLAVHTSKRLVLSELFHEIGHIVDYKEGKYRDYYKAFPTKKYLRRHAVMAEIHTDTTGAKLMAKHYPKMKFIYTYKYKKWQKFLKEYWGVE